MRKSMRRQKKEEVCEGRERRRMIWQKREGEGETEKE